MPPPSPSPPPPPPPSAFQPIKPVFAVISQNRRRKICKRRNIFARSSLAGSIFSSPTFAGSLVVLFALLMAGLTQHMPYATASVECCATAAVVVLLAFCFHSLRIYICICVRLCVCLASIMLLFIQQFSFCWPFNFRQQSTGRTNKSNERAALMRLDKNGAQRGALVCRIKKMAPNVGQSWGCCFLYEGMGEPGVSS